MKRKNLNCYINGEWVKKTLSSNGVLDIDGSVLWEDEEGFYYTLKRHRVVGKCVEKGFRTNCQPHSLNK